METGILHCYLTNKITTERITLPCQKDDTYIFGAGYSFRIDYGTLCKPNDPQGVYESYSLKGNKLFIQKSEYEIKELTTEKLVISFVKNDSTFTQKFRAF